MRKSTDILPNDEAMKKEAPLLHSISKENPFSVPESYFESLPSEIIEKCKEEENRQPLTTSKFFVLLAYKWRLLGLTACLAILCVFVFHTNNRPVSYEALAQNIPDSLIMEHLDKNITNINESTLEDLSEENTLGQELENSASPVKIASDSTNSNQDIIAYLMTTDVNVNDIVNEP